MTVDPTAAQGFTAGVDAYERGRPSYPADAVARVVEVTGAAPGATVVDVGAGTGKFTVLLVASGARVVAVEPVPAMRDRLSASLPGVDVRAGTAEALPLADAEAVGAVVAQAFHWFHHGEALDELARVVRPGGGVVLVWNSRDASVDWVRRLNEIIGWNAGQIPTYDAGDERWAELVEAHGAFGPVTVESFANDQELDEPTLLDRVASTSYIATMEPAERDAVLDDVRAAVAGFPVRFVLPYRTFVYSCRRR